MDPHSEWKEVRGDETYALDWNIERESLVWEIGGYEGRWAAQMAEKYDPHIEIFEPQGWAVEKLQDRFQASARVSIKPYGLWFMDCSLPLYRYETDGASLLAESPRSQVVPFRDIFTALHPKHGVDVCLMNIEGAEYMLIPYLIGTGLITKFRYFWCQFHNFVDGSALREEIIFKKMNETHRLKWDFYPTAVCWEAK